MAEEPRLTPQTIKVLDALMGVSGASGADIARRTGQPSGTLYPILLRLEKAGWLLSEWEEAEPSALGRPRKRLYRLSLVGKGKMRSAARELAPAIGRLAW